jgi:pimeloyl-ACP methyl ester carboxylesterase
VNQGNRMAAKDRLARSQDVAKKVGVVLQKRTQGATERYARRVMEAVQPKGVKPAGALSVPPNPLEFFRYAQDVAQRQVLFWDTLRQRGDQFVERTAQGLPPVLHFAYEIVLDGRSFDRPVNYALLKITPPEGVVVDRNKRPYIIIDPRAGHGPGIGGFKDDSQVGVALRAGHPVYFVIFYPDPEPGQTLIDVTAAEQRFVKKVRALHPKSAKPALIGNCQGGWAAMMLATASPDDTGPVVINGAPMSYWSGAWSEGASDNPMRYAGGMLGGSWAASLASDLGNGKFDGAHLVQNFENLNPANSLWDKWYHVFDKADTEPPRFLDFERWWGGYYLMNTEEIEWITRNLFVGNKLWSGEVQGAAGKAMDLREIKAPIVLFASMGDNITPPQQAFNWVADVYKSTDEIKARGQVIVGLVHEDIGHLGIFVSGKVATKEHAQIVSVLKTIERLPPGLYGMVIEERKGARGQVDYEVAFHERRLEDIVAVINRFKRADEQAFDAVATVSEFNQRAYELFARPLVQAIANEQTAKLARDFHPLRLQNWAFSSRVNPWLAWLAPAAEAVKAHRQAVADDHPLRHAEHAGAEIVSASLDYYRAVRDALTEASFFSLYANAPPQPGAQPAAAVGALASPEVEKALAAIESGGYLEALARTAFLIGHRNGGEPLPLSRLEMRQELVDEYADLLPQIDPFDWRSVRGEQEIIAIHAPERAIATLPLLLADAADRARFLALLERIVADRRIQESAPGPDQVAMFERIRKLLARPGRAAAAASGTRARAVAPKRPARARPAAPTTRAARANGKKRTAHERQA